MAVVGIGNLDRGDDAAGRLVARGLRTTLPPAITILEQSGDAADLVQVLSEYDTVIVVDAVQTQVAEPGQLHRIDAQAGPLPATFREVSTHGFGVGQAIELARALNQLPDTIVIYGIEVHDLALLRPPTPAVARGVERAICAVFDELAANRTGLV